MIWVRRLVVGSGLVAASFLVAAPVAGAVDTYVSTPPGVASTATTPSVGLPFTTEPPASRRNRDRNRNRARVPRVCPSPVRTSPSWP